MKGVLILFSLFIFLFWSHKPANAQSDLQCRVNILEIGKSGVNEMKILFGEFASMKKISSWVDASSSSSDNLKKWYRSVDSKNNTVKSESIINLFEYEYKQKGLVFNFWDKPDELYSIEITNPEISVLGIKVGDKLNKVMSKLGKNDEWTSSDGSDYWNLDYEKLGVSFVFLRDKSVKQYPMKLNKKKRVVRIEKYNNNVSLTG